MRRHHRKKRGFIHNIKETYKNKIFALLFILIGIRSMMIAGDGTAFVFLMFIGVPLFFAREEVIF